MLRISKRIFLLLLLLIISATSVFATTYKIVDYDYIVDGHTRKWAIANRVEQADEVFESVEELEKALDVKRQILWNTNIFTSVKCSWRELSATADEVQVVAVLEVRDGSSYILLPYPKYDSNSGFCLGLRYKNNNLAGTMGNAAVSLDWEQNGTDFEHSLFEFEIPVTDVLLSNGSSLFLNIAGNYNMADPDNGQLDFSTGINNLVISGITFNGSAGLSYVYNEKTFDYYNAAFSASGIKLGSVFLDAALSANINLFSDVEDSFVTSVVSLREVDLGKVVLSDTLTYTLLPEDETDIKTLSSAEVKNATSFSIKTDVITDPVIGTEIGVNFPTNYQFLTLSFSFLPFENINSKTSVTGYTSVDYGFYKLTASQAFSTEFKVLDDKFTVSPSVSLINKNGAAHDLAPRAWEADASISFKGGNIDRVISGESYFAFRDNFRKGVKTETQAMMLWNIGEEPDFILRSGVTAFFLPFKNFNPSFRVYVAASADKIDWFNQVSGNSYANADLYSFFGYTMTQEDFNELIRGVRLDSADVQSSHETNYMGYFSANLTSSFLYFEDFGHLYLSPFLDAAFFANSLTEKPDMVSGVGVEAYMIMDSHASYPIRASLGFNLESLIDKFKGNDAALEYEVFIGLGFLY